VKTFNHSSSEGGFLNVNDKESRTYQKFLRVCDFGTAHANDFTATSLGTLTFRALDEVIAEIESLSGHEASARGTARQGTETRSQARAALRDDLEAISRTARVMADDVPGINEKFRVPRNANDQELMNAARAFLADATPLKAQFIAHEMPADFLEDLQSDIDAMLAAINSQSSGVGSHVAANAALDDAMDRGNDLCRKLDAIVRNKYANNPAVLAEWTSASHTERAPRRAAAGGGSATPPTP
jgi:hypothetical protein